MTGSAASGRPPRLQGLTLRRARPDDGDALAALMNDPAVFPGVMQLPYTDGAFQRDRLAGQSGGSTNPELHLVAAHEGRMRGFALRDGEYVDALMMARLHPNPPRLAPAAGQA
jgi:hypothetical protein